MVSVQDPGLLADLGYGGAFPEKVFLFVPVSEGRGAFAALQDDDGRDGGIGLETVDEPLELLIQRLELISINLLVPQAEDLFRRHKGTIPAKYRIIGSQYVSENEHRAAHARELREPFEFVIELLPLLEARIQNRNT